MFRALFAIILAASTVPAIAQCVPVDQQRQIIERQTPIASWTVLDPAATAVIAAWYNALPPPGDEKFNLAILVVLADGRVGLLLGNDGVICVRGIVDRADLPPGIVAG